MQLVSPYLLPRKIVTAKIFLNRVLRRPQRQKFERIAERVASVTVGTESREKRLNSNIVIETHTFKNKKIIKVVTDINPRYLQRM